MEETPDLNPEKVNNKKIILRTSIICGILFFIFSFVTYSSETSFLFGGSISGVVFFPIVQSVGVLIFSVIAAIIIFGVTEEQRTKFAFITFTACLIITFISGCIALGSIAGYDWAKETYYDNLQEKAIEQKRIDLCIKLSNRFRQDSCITTIATSKKDSEICKCDIKGYKFCFYGYVQGCLVSVAEVLEDISICDKIQETGAKNGCRNKIAISTNNKELCNSVDCLRKIQGENISLTDCSILTNSKDICIRDLAKTKEDCLMIKENKHFAKLPCFSRFEDFAKEDCDSFSSSKLSCLHSIAEISQDPSICEEPPFSETSKFNCIKDTGGTITLDLCNEITDFHWRDNCLTSLAIKENDESLCELQSHEVFVKSCKDRVKNT